MSAWTDSHCHLQVSSSTRRSNTPAEVQRRCSALTTRALVASSSSAPEERARTRRSSSRRSRAPSSSTRPSDCTPTTRKTTSRRSPSLRGRAVIGWSPSASAGSTTTTSTRPGPATTSLSAQVALAKELDLALVVHARGAFDDLLPSFAARGCRLAPSSTASPDARRGRVLSRTRMRHLHLGHRHVQDADELRVPGNSCPRATARETDSPFFAPVPNRGRRTSPRGSRCVGEYVATCEAGGEAVEWRPRPTPLDSRTSVLR